MYYKSTRFIGDKLKWVIEDEYGNINKSPTKDELKLAVIGNPSKICCICSNSKGRMFRYYNDSGIWNHRHLCSGCYKNLSVYGTLDRQQIEKNKEIYLIKGSVF